MNFEFHSILNPVAAFRDEFLQPVQVGILKEEADKTES